MFWFSKQHKLARSFFFTLNTTCLGKRLVVIKAVFFSDLYKNIYGT